jgi:protein-disulfide isomerase
MQRSILFSTLLLTSLTATAMAAEATPSSLTAEQKAQMETIVRDVLKREPELVEASLRANMEKKEAAAAEAAKKVIKESHKELYEDHEDPILGNPNGTISMVVFMDPYCGYCRKLQKDLLEVVKERKDLKIIYKPYPVLSKESIMAAEEELATNAMGRFQDYHEAIYSSDAKSRKERMNLAHKKKIDKKTLLRDIEAKKVDKQLERNIQLGAKLGIRGTPAFIIGDELNPGYAPKATLISMLDEHAKKQAPKS